MSPSKPEYWRRTGSGLDRSFREKPAVDQVDAMAGRHLIADISYALERIDCSCGAVILADVDELEHDRHAPLCAAWEAHKREAALALGRQPRRKFAA